MPEEYCDRTETIIRALRTDVYDKEAGKCSSSAFKGNKLSVSRPAILSISKIFDIFHRDLDRENGPTVNGGASIGVDQLIQLILQSDRFESAFVINSPVTEPNRENPAHAEIVASKDLTRGVANKILSAVEYLNDPTV